MYLSEHLGSKVWRKSGSSRNVGPADPRSMPLNFRRLIDGNYNYQFNIAYACLDSPWLSKASFGPDDLCQSLFCEPVV